MAEHVRVLAREADAVVQPVRPFPPKLDLERNNPEPDSGREQVSDFGWLIVPLGCSIILV
jgi:hypothetical protein